MGLLPTLRAEDKERKEGEVIELFPVYVKDKYGYTNRTGKIIIKPQFDREFFRRLAWIRIDGKYGYIDKGGSISGDLQDKKILYLTKIRNPVGLFDEGIRSGS